MIPLEGFVLNGNQCKSRENYKCNDFLNHF